MTDVVGCTGSGATLDQATRQLCPCGTLPLDGVQLKVVVRFVPGDQPVAVIISSTHLTVWLAAMGNGM
jgi:hypothetical protein